MLCKDTVRLLYRLDRNFTWESGLKVSEDLVFYDDRGSEFLLRYIYWFAVRLFGCFVWRGKRVVRKWHGKVMPLSQLLP
jgi:hypothetical protein